MLHLYYQCSYSSGGTSGVCFVVLVNNRFTNILLLRKSTWLANYFKYTSGFGLEVSLPPWIR